MNNIGEIYYKYKKDATAFVETGTHEGGGVQQGIECGFEYLYSVEYHKPFFEGCVKRFKGQNNVYLYHGSSADLMSEMLEDIGNQRCLFWLDAHDTFGTGGGVPAFEELAAIKEHSRNDHSIVVDDVPLYFGDGIELKRRLLDINPNYTIEMVDPGLPSRPGYIMVAHIE